jgi:hypothetical protein
LAAVKEKQMQGVDGIREPELLARLRQPRTLVAAVALALVWLLIDAQRPSSKAGGAATAAAQQVCASARTIAKQAAAGPAAKSH